VIIGRNDIQIRRLKQDKIETDSIQHSNHSIKNAVYVHSINRIISLDSLSDKIHVFNVDCTLHTIVRPNQ
jgi:hypothetical protein